MSRSREPSVEQVAEAMRRRCVSVPAEELRSLRLDLTVELHRLLATRRYRLSVLVPWETGVERRVRELRAIRSVVTQRIVSMDDFTLDFALVGD